MRFITNVDGGDQSVDRIGSHTTKTRAGTSGYFLRIEATAEDPRRHVVHVGDNRTISRTESRAALKSARSVSSDPASR